MFQTSGSSSFNLSSSTCSSYTVSLSSEPISKLYNDFTFICEDQFLSGFNCLKGHLITPEIRNRMVDWMIEVLTMTNCTGKTFFLSVFIMEKYLKLTQEQIKPLQILLVGVTSMMIASKFEEIQPLDPVLIKTRIAHGKVTENELIQMERKMLTVIGFELLVDLSCDYLGFLCQFACIPFVIGRVSEIILILNRLEYNNQFPSREEAASALIIACKTLNQAKRVQYLIEISKVAEEELEMAMIAMQNMMYGYKIKPPKFKAVMKQLGFVFESVERQKLFRFLDQELEAAQLSLMAVC